MAARGRRISSSVIARLQLVEQYVMQGYTRDAAELVAANQTELAPGFVLPAITTRALRKSRKRYERQIEQWRKDQGFSYKTTDGSCPASASFRRGKKRQMLPVFDDVRPKPARCRSIQPVLPAGNVSGGLDLHYYYDDEGNVDWSFE